MRRNKRPKPRIAATVEPHLPKQRARMVLRVGALSDAELAAIASAEVPAQYAGLDAEFASPLCKPAARHVQRRAQQKRRKFHS